MTAEYLLKLVVIQTLQIGILAVAVALIIRVAARNRPWIAHGLWFVVLIKCVTLPLLSHPLGLFCHVPWSLSATSDSEIAASSESSNEAMTAMGTPVVSAHLAGRLLSESNQTDAEWISRQHNGLTWAAWLLMIAAIGCVLSGCMTAVRCIRWLRVVARNQVAELEPPVVDTVTILAQQIGLSSVPTVAVTDAAMGPAVVGLFRRMIVLPRCLVESLTREELSPIVAHELMHIRRGDLWSGWFQALVRCLWWFHPLVRVACRRMSHEAERCCDEQVLAEFNWTPTEYARSLLAVMEHKQQLQTLHVFPAIKPMDLTTQRMERIMSLKNGCRKRMPVWMFLIVFLSAAVALPGAKGRQKADQPDSVLDQSEDPTLVRESAAETRISTKEIRPAWHVNLDDHVSFQFDGGTVLELLAKLATDLSLDVVLDHSGLPSEEHQVSRFMVDTVQVRDLLAVIASHCDLSWCSRNEVVTFGACEPMITTPYNVADILEGMPDELESPATPDGKASDHSRFERLAELIRTNIATDTWGHGAAVVPSVAVNALVIRQSPRVHDEIADLLRELKQQEGQSTSVSCMVLDCATPRQREWLDRTVTFHSSENEQGWKLLPSAQRVRFFDTVLAGGIDVLSRPQFTIRDGEQSTIEVCDDVTGMSLTVQCVPTANRHFLRFAAAGQCGELPQDIADLTWVTMVSGQTMLLDITNAKQFEQGHRIVVALTPRVGAKVE